MREATKGFGAPCAEQKRTALMECLGDHGILQKQLKGNVLERGLMRCFQNHGAACARALCFQPSGGADAPTIARLEAWKTELRHGRGEIVTVPRRRLQKGFIDDAADGMDTGVVRAGIAAAVSIEAGQGIRAARLQRLSQHILLFPCRLQTGHASNCSGVRGPEESARVSACV